MPLSLFLLGPPRVEIDGEVITFPRQKSLALLAYLAVTGEQQRRDSLAALLWPESADARGSLRRELSSLKAALRDGDWLDAERESVSLAGDLRLDVDDFLAAATSHNPALLTQAADLYRGDFLSGFSLADAPEYDDWRFFQAEDYRRRLAAALERLIAHHQRAGDPAAAVPYARRLLALDNLHEPAHRALMRVYALAGQHAAALRQYDECVRLLDEELGVPPEDETTKLYEAIRTRRVEWRVASGRSQVASGRSQVASGRSQVAGKESPNLPIPNLQSPIPGHNLPPQATPFVGRQREMEEVRDLLVGQARRLVTIVGAGGMGKTRLGLAVAEQALAHFPAGVWFVPLANVDTADGVPAAIAATLGAPAQGENLAAQLIAYLQNRRLLLLLDNFEHLLAAADFIAELLQHAPEVALLVTTQERLNLLEEWLYPLEGLAIPADDDADDRGGESALALFESAARRNRPDFRLAQERRAVAAICRAVEGMPLGIELAASWVRVISCAEIAGEIQRGIDFLRTNLRNLPARQRSLRAVFERSWALLNEDEQTLLARLSVFVGGFTRQAAVTVTDATPVQLAALVDHSFLRRQAEDRFDMHGLLQRYAAEQLAGQPAVAAVARSRHADFYAELVAQAGWELQPGEADADAAAVREAVNILAAWRWGVENREASVVGRMMRWLVDYYRRRGDYSGGRAAFSRAVSAFRSSEDEQATNGLVGSLLLRLGQCMAYGSASSQLDEERDVLDEAISRLRRHTPSKPLDLALALGRLAMHISTEGNNPHATAFLAEAEQLYRQAENQLGLGGVLRDMGMLDMGWGRLRDAQRSLEESTQVLEGSERKSYMQSHFILGQALMMRGHYRRADAQIRRTLPFFIAQNENGLAGWAARSLGETCIATGDFAEAKHFFAEAASHFEPVGMYEEVVSALCLTPGVAARLCGEAAAESKLLDELVINRRMQFQQRISTSLHHLARLRHDQRDYEGALALLDEALSIARKIDFRYATALALTAQGHARLALQQTAAARAAYAEALEIAETEGIDRIACDALTGVAQLLSQRGDTQQAISLLTFAHRAEASEWETKRRAEGLLAELPQTETHAQIPALEEAIRLARAALNAPTQSPNLPITQSPIHLPTPTTSFIGREAELSELAALLSRPDVRLVTVVAPGGMGKTRFAIEVARQVSADYPDGVWFQSLVGVNEASQMLAALVQLLDAPMGAGDAADALLRYFARRRLLLVLDNFEQLAAHAEVLAEIVANASQVDLLVTSRVRLNLREEWAFPLAGLGMADGETKDGGTKDERIASSPAVRLFVERARQVQSDFDAAGEAQAVRAICRAVEGMPLGIELAASWLRAMKCAEIAAEIRRDVDFLSTPLRNVPAQHRSMRAVFERSWGLLTAAEQRGLARLSVFQGGFTRQAAEAVADVRLPLLSALVDHSLLRHAASGRYDIHELLRQFAAEQLDVNEEGDPVRDKHADYFLHYLSERREDLQWRQIQPVLDELLPERENLFAGWRWACERSHFPRIREAATILPLYCNLTNARESGRQLFAQAIVAVEEKAGIEDDRPGLLGILRFRQQVELSHSHMQPEAYLQRLLETRDLLLESKADNRDELARLSGAIGTQVATVGRGEEGAAWMEDAIRTFRDTGNFSDLGKIYHRFALLRTGEGKVHLADETYGKVAEAWRQAKLPPYPIVFRALVYDMQGRFAEMRHTWEQARTMEADPFSRGFSMAGLDAIEHHLGEAGVALGTLDEAVDCFRRAQAIYQSQGQEWHIVLGYQYSLGTVLRLQGQMEAARRQIEWEIATVREVGFKQRIATRLHELARLEYDEGNYAASEAALAEALAIAEEISFRFIEALILCQMGHTAAAQGKPEAAAYYRRAMEIAAEQGMNPIVLDALRGVAGLAATGGDPSTGSGVVLSLSKGHRVTQAVEWLALVASHPNGDWETKQKAQKALAEWEGKLSAEEFHAAQERGQSAQVEAVIPAVLARFA